MYEVIMTPDQLIVSEGGERIITLSGGNAFLIGMMYTNLVKYDETRAQSFIYGVLLGLNHCAITGSVPQVSL